MNYIQYTYNDDDQVTQVATPTGNITYQYDPTTHWLTSTTDLNGDTTQYTYDPTTGNLTSVTQVSSAGNETTQYDYDRLGNLALMISPSGNRTALSHDVLGDTTAINASDNLAPTAEVTSQITSPTSVTVNVSASEPILVASITYWVDGQPQSSGTTSSVRLDDATSFSFDLTGVNAKELYDYQITLTDRVGVMQTLPQGTFAGDSVPPTDTITPVTPSLRSTAVNEMTITFSEAVTGVNLAALSLSLNGGPNLLTSAQTLSTSDNVTFTLGNLAGLTASQGNYTLNLTAAGSGITDIAGNALAANASTNWRVLLTLAVASVTPTSTGFTVQFDHAVNTSTLRLYGAGSRYSRHRTRGRGDRVDRGVRGLQRRGGHDNVRPDGGPAAARYVHGPAFQRRQRHQGSLRRPARR